MRSATELAAAIRRRELGPVEAVEAHIETIERLDPPVNAVVVRCFGRAREEARAAERALAAGEDVGPLHGVPITVKEAVELEGLPFTNGSRLDAGRLGRVDAPAVGGLRAAGAIVLGKTNIPEFCCFYDADNEVYGRTSNPHDPARTPGGSSGGEAAALAMGMSALGVGSDLASSIRNPAAWCGVFGHKPSRGLVSVAGHAGFGLPPAWQLFVTIGPMARTAADLELGLRCMAGAALAPPEPGPFAVAVYEEDGLQPVAAACRGAVRRAARALAERGHHLEDAQPPSPGEARALFDTLVETELAQYVPGLTTGREDELSRYGRGMVTMLKTLRPDLGAYLDAGRRLNELQSEADEWMERRPIALCPVTPVPAPLAAEGITTVDGEPTRPGGKMTLCTWPTAFGLPAVSVPAGRDETGMPLAVQIFGRRGHDLEVLAVASELEEALGGWIDPEQSPRGQTQRA